MICLIWLHFVRFHELLCSTTGFYVLQDLEFIMMHMDNDKDGSIGLEDFAKVGNYDDLGRDDNAPSREPGTSGATIHTV